MTVTKERRKTQTKPEMTPQSLMARASKRAGLDDFGDDEFIESLQALIDSALGEANLSERGEIMLHNSCVINLVNRLKVVDELKKHPEILETPVVEPVFITGLPRSGTTILHRLMATDPNFRAPKQWEIMFPAPAPDPATYLEDPRIGKANEFLAMMRQGQQGFSKIHESAAMMPEECNGLFSTSFSARSEIVRFHVPSYLRWLGSSDRAPAYRFYKKQLQMLSWKFPEKRWLLKDPAHRYFLDSLVEVFPDARIIHTHRDPLKVVPSTCSMIRAFRSMFSESVDSLTLGPFWLDELEIGCRKGAQALKASPPKSLLNVSYKQFVADPAARIQEVYEALDLPGKEEAGPRIAKALESRQKGKHGKHVYTLEEFGLTEAMVRKAYSWYYEKYDAYL